MLLNADAFHEKHQDDFLFLFTPTLASTWTLHLLVTKASAPRVLDLPSNDFGSN